VSSLTYPEFLASMICLRVRGGRTKPPGEITTGSKANTIEFASVTNTHET